MNLPDLDSSLASVCRVGGGRGGRGEGRGPAGPLTAPLPQQIQELLSPQEPPRPLEAEDGSPDSGERGRPPPPSRPSPRPHPDPAPPPGKQLVHYTAQPLLLMEPGPADVGSGDLPVLFELGEGPYFSEGDDGADDPTISLLTGSEPPKAKDPAVS